MERETGIEPATNSLEGCDSTTELLPPTPAYALASLIASARQARDSSLPTPAFAYRFGRGRLAGSRPPSAYSEPHLVISLPSRSSACRAEVSLPSRSPPPREAPRRAKAGGEGRIRTFEAAGATDLQSVAFDRFATSPISTGGRAGANAVCALSVVRICAARDSCRPALRLSTRVFTRVFTRVSSRVSTRVRSCSGLSFGSAGIVELAKGFEPPTG